MSGGDLISTGSGSGNLRFGPMNETGYTGIFEYSSGNFAPTDVQIRQSYSLTLGTNINLTATNLTINGIMDFSSFNVFFNSI